MGTREKLTEALTKLDAAEQDLNRVRSLLSETQSTAERIKKEKDQEEKSSAAKGYQLQEELRLRQGALDSATRNEVSLTQQLEELTTSHRQDRHRTDLEITELKRTSDEQLAERDQRIEWLKAEYEKRIQALESHHAGEVEREKGRVDAALLQNEQLRRFFAEQKKTSNAGMSSLQSQLESHISRMQQHTSELRGDLNRSQSLPPGASPPPLSPRGSG